MMYGNLYELDPNMIDHATMLGYPCRELLLFAQACRHTGRNFIGIEKDADYFVIASARIMETP